MKKTTSIKIIATLSLFMCSSIYAKNSVNLVKKAQNIVNLDNYVQKYILTTGTIPKGKYIKYTHQWDSPISQIEEQFNIKEDKFNNLDNKPLNFVIDKKNHKIIIKNIVESTISKHTFVSLKRDIKQLDFKARVKPENYKSKYYKPIVIFPMSKKLIKFLSLIKKIQKHKNAQIFAPNKYRTSPQIKNKIWYEPIGNGKIIVYKYINGEWKKINTLKDN